MRDLCNTDKPLFAVLTKLTYSAYLNILWLVCRPPIVTLGASPLSQSPAESRRIRVVSV